MLHFGPQYMGCFFSHILYALPIENKERELGISEFPTLYFVDALEKVFRLP